MKKLFLALLLLALSSIAQAQEYTSRYFHYNQYYDAPVPFTITATTIDGADTNSFELGGGGANAAGRGAWLALTGADYGGANLGGRAVFHLSDDTYDTNITLGKIDGNVGTAITVTSAAANDTMTMFKGINARTATSGDIRLYTYSDAAGGAFVLSGTPTFTSGAISALTRQYSGARGAAAIEQVNGNLYFWNVTSGNAKKRWTIPATATDTVADWVFGDANTASTVATIRGARADGSDDGILELLAGGATGNGRGAGIKLYGNEVSGVEGQLYITAGATVRGHMYLQTAANANMYFQNRGSTRWKLEDNTGAWAQDASNGGNIVFAKASTGIDLGGAITFLEIPQWPIASKPNCTIGSIAVATDSNDCSAGAGDGAICYCKTANTWVLLANI